MQNKKKEKSIKMKTNFVRVMGDTPINRVLDFLIENERESWTMVEMRNEAEVGYSTLKLLIPKMLNNGLITITKTVGKSKLYKINKENIAVKKIYSLYNTINEMETQKLINI